MRTFFTLVLISWAAHAVAAPDYRTVRMEIDVNKPAAAVWSKIGPYCAISEWFDLDCKILAGEGGIGTVRSLRNGSVVEVLIAKTDLSYGYTQPAKEGSFYNLYHGFLEAKPTGRNTTKIIYTLFFDASDKPDEAAKQADIAQRRMRFEAGLMKMKQQAEK